MDFANFATMGGYALNVWSAYGLAFVGFLGIMFHALYKLDALKKKDRQ